MIQHCIRIAAFLFPAMLVSLVSAAAPPNVLLIAVDDLRPDLGCYGHAAAKTANIDRFAKSAVVFQRAYCQQAVCNPSRTSLMTGLRPDSIGVTSNHIHFRSQRPDVVTLPQHFKNHGYHAAAIGKIYHGVFPDGSSIVKWDTMGDPQSWSVLAIRFGPRYYYTEEGIAAAKQVYRRVYKPTNPRPEDWTTKLVFGPATESPDVPDNTLYDGKVADSAVAALRKLKEQDKPFFLAVGFIKPHSPYVAPKKYFDLYEDTALPSHTEFPTGTPALAGHNSGELRRYTDQPRTGKIPVENQRRVRHAYLACVSYIDAQIGRVLAELDRSGLSNNTIVVLFGDHGYHLGEQGLWGKTTNFELDTRVPLIIRAPGMKAAGQSTTSLVELVDLYPTLTELAGLPISEQLEGESLVPVLNDPKHVIKNAALSQYPRGGGLMGYSLRTPTHRLTQWVHRQSGEIRATELYDYADSLIESKNIAADSPQLVRKLSTQLATEFQLTKTIAADSADDATPTRPIGFEQFKPGPFDSLETSLGKWTPTVGKSIIDDKHAKTGRQCLQLTGGEKTSVTLDLADNADTSGELTFWAERWTKRAPFSFRIEKKTGENWQEVFNGDNTVRVGRAFLSHVRVPLGDDYIEALRFTVTSPPDTGILIDDIRLAPAQPQKIVSVSVEPLTLPALVGTEASRLAKLKIETTGTLNPIVVTQIQARLIAQAGDVSSLQVIHGSEGAAARPFGKPLSIPTGKDAAVASGPRTITGEQPLAEGSNYFWIAAKLTEDADIDRRVGAAFQQIEFSNGRVVRLDNEPTMQRLGVAVRNGGDDGVHTYRIPGLATTNKGTLIGVYDVRRRTGRDLPGDIDVGMSRSTDGGRTWEPMKVIMDMGDDPKWHYDGIGDPAVLVDRGTGTIWVAATWSHGNRSWVGSGPGLKPEETGQFMLVRSDDDGLTWSKPINITSQIKKPEWCFILQGPGKGITMRDGTIVFAAQYQDPPEQRRLPHSTIIYSKDHGETWHVGAGAFDDTTEAQVVELEPGVLMLNCRYNRKAARVVMTTRDMGKTWQKHPTSERSLIEPRACMASLIDVDQEVGQDAGGWLLFSNPDSTSGRHHITIKASPDRGKTWPKQHRLLLDEERSAGYSCMSMIDEKTIGILYEGSQAHMTFQRIPLADVIGQAEKPAAADLKEHKQSLRLPQVFGSHMVLQAEAEFPVWGRAPAGAKVTVTLGDASQSVVANSAGEWSLRFPPRTASITPTTMLIESQGQQIRFTDVLFGEVWVCAGQSNMEWPLSQSTHGEAELSSADHPQLRLLHLVGGARGSSGSYTPQHLARLTAETYCEGQWQVALADSARNFSAVAWYFGRQLQEELKVPVGLICPAVGGTPTEAWIPREALASDPHLQGLVAGNWLDNDRLGEFCRTRGEQNLLAALQAGEYTPGDELGPNHSFKPGFMWSAGIEPVIPYAIRGVIWYQGESNAETPERVHQHNRLLRLLVRQWRQAWGQGDFPFLYAQLPALNRPQWPQFREGQRRLLAVIKQTGMAVTVDTGHPTNVHPPLKQPVGQRLARWALGTTYGLNSHSLYSGPLLNDAKPEDDTLLVSFHHAGEGLKASDGQALRWFEICGDDGVFHPAVAKITGGNTIAVSSPSVRKPRHVRYAWAPYPSPGVNLVNSAGLPASPFTTQSDQALFTSRETNTRTADSRPNILLIVSEDNGPELGCYGDKFARTPHLDALAAAGVRFETAYVTQSVCSPSRSTIFTGLYPHQNGQIGLATHQFEMFRAWPTTYSILKDAGYRTGLIGKTHVNPANVIEGHVDFRRITSSNFAKKNLGDYATESAAFINASDQPFFLTVNFPDAHWPVQNQVQGRPKQVMDAADVGSLPYIGIDNERLRGHLTGFYNCMSRLDECVGELLHELEKSGKADNTLVIYIGDHGAQFARGKVFVTEGGLRIPFIVRWPGKARRGLVSQQMVSTLDLLPTIVAAAGAKPPDNVPGKNLAGALAGQEAPLRDYLFAQRNCDWVELHFPQRAIRDKQYKLIKTLLSDRRDPGAHKCLINGASNFRGSPTYEELKTADEVTQKVYETLLNPPQYQLYDLKKDPHEFTNLADDPQYAAVKKRLIARLEQWQQETNDPLRVPKLLDRLTEEIDTCRQQKIRSPKGGWRYVEYLAPAVGGKRSAKSALP